MITRRGRKAEEISEKKKIIKKKKTIKTNPIGRKKVIKKKVLSAPITIPKIREKIEATKEILQNIISPQKKQKEKNEIIKKNSEKPIAVSSHSLDQINLPDNYQDNKIVLLVRDPNWIFAYWEISLQKNQEIASKVDLDTCRLVLRVHDVTDVDFNGKNSNFYNDIRVSGGANNWYIEVGQPYRDYCVDLGYLDASGKFYLIARSNVVRTPRDSASNETDEKWVSIDFDKIYKLSGGHMIGKGSEAVSMFWQQKKLA